MINKITIESLVIVAKAITDIGRSAVFAGGSVTPFLITDNASAKPRPTKDIDVIVGTEEKGSGLVV
jgi:uridylate kinase